MTQHVESRWRLAHATTVELPLFTAVTFVVIFTLGFALGFLVAP